jgi:hypothetical protein
LGVIALFFSQQVIAMFILSSLGAVGAIGIGI